MLSIIPNTQVDVVDDNRKIESPWYSFLKQTSDNSNRIEKAKVKINDLSPPNGGDFVDTQAREAISQIINILKSL